MPSRRNPYVCIYGSYCGLPDINCFDKSLRLRSFVADGGFMRVIMCHCNAIDLEIKSRAKIVGNSIVTLGAIVGNSRLFKCFVGRNTIIIDSNAVNSLFIGVRTENSKITRSHVVEAKITDSVVSDTKITESSHIEASKLYRSAVVGAAVINSVMSGSVIGEKCTVEGSEVTDSTVGKNVVIAKSKVNTSEIGENTTIGTMAHLREKVRVGKNCRIGNFVEIKNSTLGDFVKAAHLAYIGDATVGNECNIGCGVVFANFDGKRKHRTTVGNNCFLGCNCNLVAPLTIGNNCFLGAGTTLTRNLPDDSFACEKREIIIKKNTFCK
ncbi:MAG: DapH/DapD/GlmU-related protein [Clostridia bacterium]|nr:DapH/DapD/GlmU-related protein [Clostridia bacterium]